MKITLIISVYRDVKALRVVLDALRYQTFKDFDIIISEDGCDPHMEAFIESYESLQPITHLTQEDEGWRKSKALNQAVKKGRGDYLIFIDGDCLLHHRFIEEHKKLSHHHGIVAGEKVSLGPSFSKLLLDQEIETPLLEKMILKYAIKLKADGAQSIEDGFYLGGNQLLSIIPILRPVRNLKSYNMSFHKAAIEAINGFDEDYECGTIGHDVDIAWRFEGLGYRIISARNLAVQYQLHQNQNVIDDAKGLKILEAKKRHGDIECANGLLKLGQSKDLILIKDNVMNLFV